MSLGEFEGPDSFYRGNRNGEHNHLGQRALAQLLDWPIQPGLL
jgi:hypothetical protein